MSSQILTYSLDENIGELKTILEGCDDFTYRYFTTQSGITGCIIYSLVAADSKYISKIILPSLMALEIPPKKDFWVNAITTELPFLPQLVLTQWSDITLQILAGLTLILFDGSNEGLIADTGNIQSRPIEKPDTEPVIRGPLEAFAEKLSPNLAIIRGRFKNPNLKINKYIMGQESRTNVALLYLEGEIDIQLLATIRERLNSITMRSVQESGFLTEFLAKNTYTPFPLIQSTERPDKTIAALLEGRAAILVEGSPFALLLPTTFWQFFQASDDYFEHFLVGSIVRFLRYIAYFIASSLPALYIAFTVFHPEMLPLRFLFSLSSARENVPLSTVLEVLLMLFVLDIFREAVLRLPRTVGTAIGIVGALVMGEAAVSAGIISPVMVIVIALTAVATFAIPTEDLRSTVRIFSYFLVILSSLLGLYGFLLGASVVILHASSLEILGVPYLSPIATLHWKEWSDVLIRAPWHLLDRKKQKVTPQSTVPDKRGKK